MTVQVGDIYKHNQIEYEIVKTSAPLVFNPQNYGIRPESVVTCCWNGYWCEYTTVNGNLLLETLYIHSKDNCYPQINGICAEPDNPKVFEHMGHHFYKHLNIPIPYTGKILIVKGYVPGYSSPIGHRHILGYQAYLELIFENGILNTVLDQTHIAQELRDQVKKHLGEFESTFFHNMRTLHNMQLKTPPSVWWL